MRYTTVIDVTEIADVWQNPNITRLYFFMALKCGYHDDDRDILRISLRNLASQASLTLSATRHALKVLETAKLVAHEKEAWRVTKFVLDKKPTSRTQKTTTTMSASEEAAEKAVPIGLEVLESELTWYTGDTGVAVLCHRFVCKDTANRRCIIYARGDTGAQVEIRVENMS